MVRNYKPKTDRRKVDGSLMERAVEEVMKGRSVRQTSKDLAIDRRTLSRNENVEFEDDETDLVNKKSKEPENGDFALKPLNSKQKTLHYVGKIINLTREDVEQIYEVDFYR
ncbi:hypothetical protein AVEN_211121-1 [Araneus ventricosus]|uniref:Uncharacterized protein n=1 Tax=Araneus ventricosus TaxID=182803 RepID=A0A4Y2QAX4_ARAVE|nr:hypothetical protein AVEN_211121-1 [Araneus ventricosus]